MPSPANSPYRSRLFNFLNRQSLRLTAQTNRVLRNVKVAAVWGVQILLYPFYLLTQASLSIARQILSPAKTRLKSFPRSQTHPQETLPAADAPIQQVLGEVGRWGDEETRGRGDAVTRRKGDEVDEETIPKQPTTNNQQQTTNNKQPTIQGVATLLSNRNLVLVAPQNQVLEVLTLEQQQRLSAKISWEVANLLRQRRLELSSSIPLAPRTLVSLVQPRLLPPVKLFWQLMAWIQTSPVAIAANLFGESQLACSITILPEPTQLSPSQPQPDSSLPEANEQVIILRLLPPKALAFLDHRAAELESHQLVPGTEVVIVLRERTYQLLQKLQQQLRISGDSPASLEETQTLKARIRDLIYAALAYFFGKKSSNLSQTSTTQQLSTGETNGLTGNDPNLLPPVGQALEEPQTIKAKIQALIYAAVEYFFGKESSNLSQAQTTPQLSTGETNRLAGNDPNLLPPVEPALEEPQTIKAKIQALIYAAVEYFFGKSGSHLPWTITLQQLSTSVNPPGVSATSLPPVENSPNSVVPEIEPDPWLTLEDLFGKQDVPPTNPTPFDSGENATSTAQLPEAFGSKMPVKPGNYFVPSRQKAKNKKQKVPTPTPQQKLALSNEDVNPPSAILPIEAPEKNLAKKNQQPASEWIDTEASSTGYVKHPLEQILGWLDSTMLRLEEFALRVWRWLRRR
ncbi:MAG: hypothetical protein F6J92_14920 [Symploca sp. SIO1A3]|nr:hypothetical protein [Symploca sp. SIO1A3]